LNSLRFEPCVISLHRPTLNFLIWTPQTKAVALAVAVVVVVIAIVVVSQLLVAGIGAGSLQEVAICLE
jgi:hypothetical protein